jgi:hypothetical protein
VAGVERRLIARIEIAYRTERGECSDIDEGIVRYGGLSCEVWMRRILQETAPVVAPGYWMGIDVVVYFGCRSSVNPKRWLCKDADSKRHSEVCIPL